MVIRPNSIERQAVNEQNNEFEEFKQFARANGHVFVPIKPTSEMLTAGSKQGEMDVGSVWKIFQAMINAAPR